MTIQLICPLFGSSRRVSSARKDLPRNDTVKPTCSHDTLHNAKEINMHGIDNPYYENKEMTPPVVRQAAPPGSISEGARFQRESTLRIQ
jgi:hypothetical protein